MAQSSRSVRRLSSKLYAEQSLKYGPRHGARPIPRQGCKGNGAMIAKGSHRYTQVSQARRRDE